MQVYHKLAQRIQSPTEDPIKQENALFLLLYLLQFSGRQDEHQQAEIYPGLVELLRRAEQHSERVVELAVQAVSIIVKQGPAGCSVLVDCGVVT